jgi:hypothetical protein
MEPVAAIDDDGGNLLHIKARSLTRRRKVAKRRVRSRFSAG